MALTKILNQLDEAKSQWAIMVEWTLPLTKTIILNATNSGIRAPSLMSIGPNVVSLEWDEDEDNWTDIDIRRNISYTNSNLGEIDREEVLAGFDTRLIDWLKEDRG